MPPTLALGLQHGLKARQGFAEIVQKGGPEQDMPKVRLAKFYRQVRAQMNEIGQPFQHIPRVLGQAFGPVAFALLRAFCPYRFFQPVRPPRGSHPALPQNSETPGPSERLSPAAKLGQSSNVPLASRRTTGSLRGCLPDLER